MMDENGGCSRLEGMLWNVDLDCRSTRTTTHLFIANKVLFDLLLRQPWQIDNNISIECKNKETYILFPSVMHKGRECVEQLQAVEANSSANCAWMVHAEEPESFVGKAMSLDGWAGSVVPEMEFGSKPDSMECKPGSENANAVDPSAMTSHSLLPLFAPLTPLPFCPLVSPNMQASRKYSAFDLATHRHAPANSAILGSNSCAEFNLDIAFNCGTLTEPCPPPTPAVDTAKFYNAQAERVKPTRALNGVPKQLDCALARLAATCSGTNLPSQGLILRADSAIESPADTTQVSCTFVLPHAELIHPAHATDKAFISPRAQLLEGPAILTITPQELPTSSSISSTSSSTLLTTFSQVPSIYFTAPASNKLLMSVRVETRCNLVVLDPGARNERVHAPRLSYTLRVVQPALLVAAYNKPFLPQLTSLPPMSRFAVHSCSASGLSTSGLSMSLGNTTQTNMNHARSKSSLECRSLTVCSNSTSSTELWMIHAYHNLQLEWDQTLWPCPNPTGPSLVSAEKLSKLALSTLLSNTGPTKVGQPGPCSNVPPPQPLMYQVPPHMPGQVLAVRTCGLWTYVEQNCATALTLMQARQTNTPMTNQPPTGLTATNVELASPSTTTKPVAPSFGLFWMSSPGSDFAAAAIKAVPTKTQTTSSHPMQALGHGKPQLLQRMKVYADIQYHTAHPAMQLETLSNAETFGTLYGQSASRYNPTARAQHDGTPRRHTYCLKSNPYSPDLSLEIYASMLRKLESGQLVEDADNKPGLSEIPGLTLSKISGKFPAHEGQHFEGMRLDHVQAAQLINFLLLSLDKHLWRLQAIANPMDKDQDMEGGVAANGLDAKGHLNGTWCLQSKCA
jgi:hypothetical protein